MNELSVFRRLLQPRGLRIGWVLQFIRRVRSKRAGLLPFSNSRLSGVPNISLWSWCVTFLAVFERCHTCWNVYPYKVRIALFCHGVTSWSQCLRIAVELLRISLKFGKWPPNILQCVWFVSVRYSQGSCQVDRVFGSRKDSRIWFSNVMGGLLRRAGKRDKFVLCWAWQMLTKPITLYMGRMGRLERTIELLRSNISCLSSWGGVTLQYTTH